jgi:hypothetical protein
MSTQRHALTRNRSSTTHRTHPALRVGAFVLSLALAAAGPFAADQDRSHAAPAAGTRLQSLAWMSGSWVQDSAGTRIEEHWTAPLGGIMLGMHRDAVPNRRTTFEFLRIVEDTSGVAYLASPGGGPVTRFPLASAGPRRVVFENLEHDFPQRVIYWLGDDGALHARVEGEVNGKLESEEWRWPKGRLSR